MDNLYLTSDAGNEETFSVTIIDQHSRTHTEHQADVDFVTLNLMLNAEYVTIRGNTIEKKSTRVDDNGSVYFYGFTKEISAI